ncbi:hypothetical protein HMPREF9577_02044 [Cutibacterium acnes HL110PA3]|nr:hypothetical protein HMPREF9577_02044 [Cutibacterium acnes HL110PA3]
MRSEVIDHRLSTTTRVMPNRWDQTPLAASPGGSAGSEDSA